MGLLDGMLGGVVGAEMATVVNGLIAKHGGVSGIVNQLQQHGLGETVQSWVGTGPNQGVSADALHQALGPELIAELASRVGMTPQDLMTKLAQVLPEAVDKLTPGGRLPPG